MTGEAREWGRWAGKGYAGPAFFIGRIAGWLVVPLYVAGALAGLFLELRAGLWENENLAENLVFIGGSEPSPWSAPC